MATAVPIPEHLAAAYDRDPSDLILVRALADYFEEEGNPTAADCLRWVVEKGRVPAKAPMTKSAHWCFRPCVYCPPGNGLPSAMQDHNPNGLHDLVGGNTETRPHQRLLYLLNHWERLPEEVRHAAWEWTSEAETGK